MAVTCPTVHKCVCTAILILMEIILIQYQRKSLTEQARSLFRFWIFSLSLVLSSVHSLGLTLKNIVHEGAED